MPGTLLFHQKQTRSADLAELVVESFIRAKNKHRANTVAFRYRHGKRYRPNSLLRARFDRARRHSTDTHRPPTLLEHMYNKRVNNVAVLKSYMCRLGVEKVSRY